MYVEWLDFISLWLAEVSHIFGFIQRRRKWTRFCLGNEPSVVIRDCEMSQVLPATT